METLQKQTLYVCGCCKHTLPSEAFYVDKKTGLPNNYCKECRKSASRKYRKTEKRTLARDDREPYPVITSTKDPDLRQKLILSALQTVRASIKRKKQKLCEVLSFMDILPFFTHDSSTGQSENLHRLERRNAGSSALVSAESYEICLYVWNGRCR
jgi:hypothetical protein